MSEVTIGKDFVSIPVNKEETREQALINAVARYVETVNYPDLVTVLAILGIEKRESDGEPAEL